MDGKFCRYIHAGSENPTISGDRIFGVIVYIITATIIMWTAKVFLSKNYFMDVNIIPCDIVRDENGLALSSRNVYLKENEKQRALSLARSLKRATKLIMAGEENVERIKKEMLLVLKDADEVEYVAIVDREFNALERVEIGNTIILVAAWVGKPRLIDNLWI